MVEELEAMGEKRDRWWREVAAAAALMEKTAWAAIAATAAACIKGMGNFEDKWVGEYRV